MDSSVFVTQVVLVNGVDDLPLRLRCFWKCDPTVTNYRIDYKYNDSSVKGAPLTGLAICVSVDGVVSRHLCKPEGKWYVLSLHYCIVGVVTRHLF